jgi:creatinine amidohydrolase
MVIDKCAEEGITVVSSPTVPFGISHHHMKFPGSITLTSSTITMVLWEIVQSLYHHGFRKFVLLLGHGGNTTVLRLCAQDFAAKMPDCIFLAPDWLPIIYASYKDILKSERWMDEHHSGEAETTRMIASTPKLVDLKKAKIYYADPKVDPYVKPAYGGNPGKEDGSIGMKEVTPVGSMGNPKLATSETGERLYAIATDWLVKVIKAELIK